MMHSAFKNRPMYFEAVADDGSMRYARFHFDGDDFVLKPGKTPEEAGYRVEEVFS